MSLFPVSLHCVVFIINHREKNFHFWYYLSSAGCLYVVVYTWIKIHWGIKRDLEGTEESWKINKCKNTNLGLWSGFIPRICSQSAGSVTLCLYNKFDIYHFPFHLTFIIYLWFVATGNYWVYINPFGRFVELGLLRYKGQLNGTCVVDTSQTQRIDQSPHSAMLPWYHELKYAWSCLN